MKRPIDITLRDKVFSLITEEIQLGEFEQWLNSQTNYFNLIDNDLFYFEIYNFNYHGEHSRHEFIKLIITLLGGDEFELQCVKAYLKRIILEPKSHDDVLYKLLHWEGAFEDELVRVGAFFYDSFEHIPDYCHDVWEVKYQAEVCEHSKRLLSDLLLQEFLICDFTLSDYNPEYGEQLDQDKDTGDEIKAQYEEENSVDISPFESLLRKVLGR
ncbi:hypothetical protein FUAX_17350 [Fulvitalea axinellae]|uniref:Uncharacterized protein n=1 Tax=Fulvitalea axinellae TaxID=1182444 RepID=A0AAU9CMQ6_9BACT|nr:hypothetical protein FUAX_17350 [Fulvitalea axinellae]